MKTLDELIEQATASGGSERANYQLFISGLCDALGLPAPVMSTEFNHLNDYVYERSLDYRHPDGSSTKLYVDCYKRGSFVLEAKQSARRQAQNPHQTDMFGSEANSRKLGHAKRGSAGWDRVMRSAYLQAVDYTRHLPVEHGYPPFVILVDVGHVIELYADFSGQGKNYAQFPDAQSFRIGMDDLRDPIIQARLKAVWTDPHSLDPAKKSAEVTRDIAARLARIAKNLEGKHDPRDVAEFLMRCLFSMFAEDVGLLPENLMVDLLAKLVDHPERFVPAMQSLWTTMDKGGYEPHAMADLKHFNGGLFANPKALPLAPEDINELLVAARQDWRDVEPAIFGTLLERALDPRERSKLGAHYTPRAYVERLVVPTIIEPLRDQWSKTQGNIELALAASNPAKALAEAKAFHHELCTVRVLDPACGTGNFLYVSLELMKKLEGEVLAAIEGLGEDQSRLMMEGETVNPRQFYGLEINPRAVPIADLVLWIGYLKWQLRTAGLSAISEPVLHAYGTIRQQDAILAYDSQDLVRDDNGAPVTRWDGVTRMTHPITGELVPDPQARIELYAYRNPRPARWPEVEFIVGNPPFIGNKRMRSRLGDGYVDALRQAYPELPDSIDFVMYWWVVAARKAAKRSVKSFGLVTTNSIFQEYGRKVVAPFLTGKNKIGYIFAMRDHPWVDDLETAQVRVSMTVLASGVDEGTVSAISREDIEGIAYRETQGQITEFLTIGANPAAADELVSNSDICLSGVTLVGRGFRILPGDTAIEAKLLKRYRNGKDVNSRPRNELVIDTLDVSLDDLSREYPRAFEHLANTVRLEREEKRGRNLDANDYADRWWQFAKPRKELRRGLAQLKNYVVSTQTSRHRFFVKMDSDIVPDIKLICFVLDEDHFLAVLSSLVHWRWAEPTSGRLGVGNDPVYSTRNCFNPFPFPDLSENPAAKARLAALGERLDTFRKERLAAHDFLTMTGLYNSLERVRELEWKAGPGRAEDSAANIESLSDKERDAYDAGHIAILKDIHDEIDTLVFAAYGWSDLAPRLVGMPGATTPSPYKSADQLAAEEELLTRLVALNQTRAAEEARGLVRWLRPDYQIPKLGHKIARPDGVQAEADLTILPGSDKPVWPSNDNEQISVLVDVLRKASAPVPPEALAMAFDGRNTPKRRERIADLLETLTTIGLARTGQLDGQTRYFIPR